MLRKNARVCDVTKIITIGRIKYESLENGTEKFSQVNLCAEPSIKDNGTENFYWLFQFYLTT
jgi:hypothetical protein